MLDWRKHFRFIFTVYISATLIKALFIIAKRIKQPKHRTINYSSLPGTVLILALKVPWPDKSLSSQAKRNNWPTYLNGVHHSRMVKTSWGHLSNATQYSRGNERHKSICVDMRWFLRYIQDTIFICEREKNPRCTKDACKHTHTDTYPQFFK